MRVLRDEHRALRGIARILKMDGEIVAGGGEIDTGVLRDIVRYLREFPNRIHHPKEEAFLFKALRARHREAAGLLDRLGHEHEAEEQKVEALSAAVESFERGEDGAGKRLAEAASGYGGFLESHITLEDEEVFPLAERVLRGLQRLFAREPAPADAISAKEGRQRVKEMFELTGLTGFEHRYPHELSGGQQQRVALARALAVHPDILLLDEPLSNLDAELRFSTRRQLAELQKRLGTTAIYVTHDQEEALELAHRIAIMRDGVCEQIGTPDEVLDAPATPFVKGFLERQRRISRSL